jgi:hypothetical protein
MEETDVMERSCAVARGKDINKYITIHQVLYCATASHISGLDSFPTPQVFYTCFYNHAHRLRLEKPL